MLNPSFLHLCDIYWRVDAYQALTAFCRAYLISASGASTPDTTLLHCITSGTNWILDKPAVHNVNYDASIIEGLAYAYLATGNAAYLNRAMDLASVSLFATQNSDGSFYDAHNRQPWYHGFNTSALIALKKALPGSGYESFAVQLTLVLEKACGYLVSVTSFGATYDPQWPGIAARVWAELKELSNSGQWRALYQEELDSLANCLYQVKYGDMKIEEQTGFPLPKLLYHHVQIGMALEVFYYTN